MTAWLPVYWSQYPEWKIKVREEVDATVAKHRSSPSQSSIDVLNSLSLEDWEAEFPIIDLSLRESIRLGLTGTDFRKNTGDKDIQIGKSGEVIPEGMYAVFLIDNIHLDPDIYRDPLIFDPSRYFDDRAEDKKLPHSFVGWGSGRHPCLGMRFAKLEAIIIGAYLAAMFDYELSDKDGRQLTQPPPPIDRNRNQVQKPAESIYVRYKARKA
jgi:sterol 14-demethylase